MIFEVGTMTQQEINLMMKWNRWTRLHILWCSRKLMQNKAENQFHVVQWNNQAAMSFHEWFLQLQHFHLSFPQKTHPKNDFAIIIFPCFMKIGSFNPQKWVNEPLRKKKTPNPDTERDKRKNFLSSVHNNSPLLYRVENISSSSNFIVFFLLKYT